MTSSSSQCLQQDQGHLYIGDARHFSHRILQSVSISSAMQNFELMSRAPCYVPYMYDSDCACAVMSGDIMTSMLGFAHVMI